MRILAITGGSGSGKTAVVNKLIDNQILNKFNVIESDRYYHPTNYLSCYQRLFYNYDQPGAFDFDALVADIASLKNGREVLIPAYSYISGERENKIKRIISHEYLCVEGIMLLNNKELVDLFDIAFYIETTMKNRLERNIYRDVHQRGRNAGEVKKRFFRIVNPMHNKYIEPSKSKADVIVDGNQSLENCCETIIKYLKNA
jgi:uridine kinase